MALRLWYRMSSTADSSGGGHTLSAVNGPTLVVGARNEQDGAYNLSGNTALPQYLTRANMTALNVTDNFSLSARIRPTGYSATNYFGLQNGIICKGPATTYNWAMQVSSATSVAFCKRTSPESLQFNTFTGLPSLTNVWTTITMVITGGYVNLYLNGSYYSQQAVSNIQPGTNDSILVGAMGGGTGTSFTAFTGSIDDVRVYDHALNSHEVAAVHEQGESGTINFFM